MDETAWQRCVEFHGHSCPGLAIGFKAVEGLRQQFGFTPSADEELVCVTENDACGLDAIQLLTGCSIGKGNLILRNRGKMAFSFFNRLNNESVRLLFKLPISRSDKGRDELQQMILESAPDTLFSIGQPSYRPPEKARIFDSIPCDRCNEPTVEHLIRLSGGERLCLDCFERYDRGW